MAEEQNSTLSAAYGKIRTQINSGIPAVRRPATLLLAIEATLKKSLQDEEELVDPRAYYAALESTLDQLMTTPGATKVGSDKRELLEATLYLLSLLVPHLEPLLMRSKMSLLPTLNVLFKVFATHAPALKSLIIIANAVLSSLTANQLEKEKDCRAVYAQLLTLSGDARPKVRRKAQEAVTALLAFPPPPAVLHPYSILSSKYILDRLEEAVKGAKRGGKKEENTGKKGLVTSEEQTGSDEGRAIALLVFVKNLGGAWHDDCTPLLMPTLLSTLTLSSSHLTLTTLTLLAHLFSSSRAADALSTTSVQETLEALVEARPKGGDSDGSEKLMAGWVEGVGEGMVAFARGNPTGALATASTLFPTIIPLLASATTTPLRTATELCLSLIIRHCVPDAEVNAALVLAPEFDPSATPVKQRSKKSAPVVFAAAAPGSALLGLIEIVEKSLTSSRYAASALPHVLALASALFLRLRLRPSSSSSARPPPAATTLLSKTLVLVAKMREDERFEWKREAEEVLASAIKVCGPEWILNVMPLGLEEGSNPAKARAWLLPLLKPAITNTRLGHFRETFVPLSAYLFSKAEAARAAERGMEAKVWETLMGQIWALLSGYCEVPTDVVEAFDNEFLSLLANILYAQPSLRPSIFKALSTLLASAVSTASSTSPPELLFAQFGLTPTDGQRDLAHLKSMASSILGVSFNVYGKLHKGEGAYVLECVGNWMGVLPAEDVAGTYDRIEGLLLQALEVPLPKPQRGHGAPKEPVPGAPDADTIPATHALLDILVTLIPHSAPIEGRLFDLACGEKVLGSGDHAVQKKGYRILSRLAEERGGSVIEGRVGDVIEQLVESSGAVAMGAKRDRTLLLSTLVPLLPPSSLHHIPSLIPEAVLGTKESNEKTREAAYDLLVGMGRKMMAGQGGVIQRNKIKGMEDGMAEDVDATMEEFVTMVSAGLAGSSPHMISATITSLSRLVYEFHKHVSETTLQELLTTLILFLSSANREIVRSAVGYVKVAIVSLPSSLVEPSLPTLIPALINWSHEHSNHFKVKIRHILERLIRKFGLEKIEREVPEDDQKLVQNIRKRQMRSKKKKEARLEAEGEDQVMEDVEAAPKPQTAARSAYDEVLYGSDSDISGSDDDDRTAAAAKPQKAQNRKSQQKKNKAKEDGAFIHEDDNEVLDLLDDRMMSRISASRPTASTRKPLESHFKTDDSGRLEITEEALLPSSRNQPSKKPLPNENEEENSMGAYLEAMRGEDGHTRDAKGRVRFNKTQGKRGRGDEDGADLLDGIKEMEVGGRKEKKAKRESVKIGAEFKAKRAGGDVKKDGVAPYAYIPLSNVAGKNKGARGPKVNITGNKKGGRQ